MSNASVKQRSDVSSVEQAIDTLVELLPVKSITVIRDVVAGVILGEVDEVDHEMELAAGVSYVVIGLGKLPTEFGRGIELLDSGGAK